MWYWIPNWTGESFSEGFSPEGYSVEALSLVSPMISRKQTSEIESLKITVRLLNNEDIKTRKLPNQITGLVVTKIENDSPLKNTTLAVNDVITEAQKKKIRSINDLRETAQKVINSNQQTILLAIYNNQNQRRYLGVKLK